MKIIQKSTICIGNTGILCFLGAFNCLLGIYIAVYLEPKIHAKTSNKFSGEEEESIIESPDLSPLDFC